MAKDDQDAVEAAVYAVQNEGISVRSAEKKFGVSRGRITRRVKGEVEMTARNGPAPILTDGEKKGLIKAIEQRTRFAQCFTNAQLACFMRKVVEDSPYRREIPETFPCPSTVDRFISGNKEFFSRRHAQSLEEARAKASTVENVSNHYQNYEKSIQEMEKSIRIGSLPPSQIWNLDESGICGQVSRNKLKVIATKGMRANVTRESCSSSTKES
jgi:hypothetical protein